MSLLTRTTSAFLFSAAFLAAEPSCSLATLRGTYGFADNGTAVFGQTFYFFAAAGKVKVDGAGNVTAKDTASTNGQVQRRTYSGTYTLAADCTGSIVFTYPDGSHVNIEFVQTDAGNVVSGTASRQSLPDAAP